MLIVHVSGAEAAGAIRRAQDLGLRIYGETCPQYLFLTAEDLDRDGMEGAKFCCSPPPRDAANQEHVWRGLANGTFQVFSSDHAPYRFDETGKLAAGPEASFKQIANGVPGLELRLPMLYSEGVGRGRIDLNRFVALASTNAARLYGLYPRKGTIAIGSDADLAIWDPDREVTRDVGRSARQCRLHPLRRAAHPGMAGDRALTRTPGRRRRRASRRARQRRAFLRCERPQAARPLGRRVPEMDKAMNFGATI